MHSAGCPGLRDNQFGWSEQLQIRLHSGCVPCHLANDLQRPAGLRDWHDAAVPRKNPLDRGASTSACAHRVRADGSIARASSGSTGSCLVRGQPTRNRNIGLRMTRGATQQDVQWMVLRQAAVLGIFGCDAGPRTRAWRARLSRDGRGCLGSPSHGGGIGSWADGGGTHGPARRPARRAARIEPTRALKAQCRFPSHIRPLRTVAGSFNVVGCCQRAAGSTVRQLLIRVHFLASERNRSDAPLRTLVDVD